METRISTHCENLPEFLKVEKDYELVSEGDVHVIRCKLCFMYLGDPVASSSLKRKPTALPGNSLATGLSVSDKDYKRYCVGSCQPWYRLKKRLLLHIMESPETHINAVLYARDLKTVEARQTTVVRNQLRTAIGIVQAKAAAVHYENRIAELHRAGADVGDFGHSRILFPQMIAVACCYVDRETQAFLSKSLPNTGLPPHYYVTADKSTNHRISNQVTMICPVVDGKRRPIPLGMKSVYESSDGCGGKGGELADGIYKHLKDHVNVSGIKLLSMQGKVTDGQYINEPFVTAMNNPMFNIIKETCSNKEDAEVLLDSIWWECHWDPGHWLDKVFSKYHDSQMVSRILSRVALFHQLFRHGKMHAVAKVTAKELKLPFSVTLSYAPQRFMSSSYLALKNLQRSYEVYVETFKDHHNAPYMMYKLCGSDFIFDLCGIIDLLWPMVVLMLRAQQEWCPGWKFPAFIKKVRKQIKLFQQEIGKTVPSKLASQLLHAHAKEIEEMRYGKSQLVLGWILQKEKASQDDEEQNTSSGQADKSTKSSNDAGKFNWIAREPSDCRDDLKKLAGDILQELDTRFERSFPDLNNLLHQCLDFGILLNGICGKRADEKKIPVNQSKFAKQGAEEFSRCVRFVSRLPHVAALNLPLCEERSGEVFWSLKKVLLSFVWGDTFQSLFALFFKILNKDGKLEEIHLPQNAFLLEFETTSGSSREFSLSDVYAITLNNKVSYTVVLQEDVIIQALYTDASFYTRVGQEFCILFDIMYAKTGTEAVVESFYRVVEKQEMDGGQSIQVLGNRAKVDWCFPPILQCEKAFSEMAKLYIHGDKALGLKRHHVPVYKSKQSSGSSIVLDRISTTAARLPYLV